MRIIDHPDIIIVVQHRRITGVAVLPEPAALHVSQLADHPVTGLLAPDFHRAALVPALRQLQLLLLQPRHSVDKRE